MSCASSGRADGRTRWETFAHGADIGVRGFGSDRAGAFEQAGVALTSVVTDPGSVRPRVCITVRCEAPDDEVALVEWLNAIVYEMDTRVMLFSRYEVELGERTLTGRAWGEPVDVLRHRPAVEIKGATFTEVRVAELEPGRWLAQCVVDV